MTQPQVDGTGKVTVKSDVDLVKSALLYADEVELLSAGASILQSVSELATPGPTAACKLIAAVDEGTLSQILDNPLPPNWQEFAPPPTSPVDAPAGQAESVRWTSCMTSTRS